MTQKSLVDYQTVTLKTSDISELLVGGQKTLHAIVSTEEFLNLNIPNKANSREFTGNKNKAVDEMIKTLKSEPEMFRFKNLGIRLVASDYLRNGDDLTLLFDTDEGIFNGGHTYTVLKTYGRQGAFVNMTIDLQLPKHKLVDISISLNMSKKLEVISQGEKKGAFEWIKAVLPYEQIVYKEGDEGSYAVDDVLKVANLFKLGKGKKYSEAGLNQSIRSKASIVRENNEKQTLTYTGYILPDMWELYKEIRINEKIVNQLPENYSKKGVLLQGMAVCFIFGLRNATVINKNMIPMWKEGMDKEKALKICIDKAKDISKEIKKHPFKTLKPEAVYRDTNFQLFVKFLFAEELIK